MTGRPHELDDIGVTPGSASTSSRNLSPRISKLRYWSNEAQAGDSSTTGSAMPDAAASRGGKLDRPVERAGDVVRHLARRASAAKSGRRLADQIGLADAREKVRERGDAAGLRLAAGDPEDVGEAGQRLRRGVGVGRLGIVDEQHAALAGRPAPCDARGRETSAGPAWICVAVEAERQRRARPRRRRSAHCARRAASRCRRDRRSGRALPPRGHDRIARPRRRCRRASGRRTETRTTRLPARCIALGRRRAPVVVDADDRGAVRRHAGDQPLLDGGVVRPACRGGRDGPR